MTRASGARRRLLEGMPGFTLVWTGQLVSVLASRMTSFAMTIWAFQETGSATALGGVATAFSLPFVLLAPIAGVMVDRYNRKLMMMVSDLAAAGATVGILALHSLGSLQIWHLYGAAALMGLGNTFQWPAYSAAITTMLPKAQYGRANGMMSLVDSGPSVLAPMLAGALLPFTGIRGILVLDIATFFLAIGTLLAVHVPQPAHSADGEAGRGSILRESLFGFRYILARRSLFSLLLFFLTLNFIIGLAFPVLAPFVLSRTGNDSTSLGAVQSAWAAGAVAGGLLMGIWGGFRRRVTSIFVGEAGIGLVGMILFGLGRSVWSWMAAAGVGAVFMPLSNGASQAIWQAKVAPDVQGRVFSARQLIAWSMIPVTPIVSGALADYVTEPAMRSSGWLAQTFGGLVGTGPGSGMALQFVLAGVAYIGLVAAVYFLVPAVRNLEDLLPDHDAEGQDPLEAV